MSYRVDEQIATSISGIDTMSIPYLTIDTLPDGAVKKKFLLLDQHLGRYPFSKFNGKRYQTSFGNGENTLCYHSCINTTGNQMFCGYSHD